MISAAKYFSIPDNGKGNFVPKFLFWSAVILLFMMANDPAHRLATQIGLVPLSSLIKIYEIVFFCGLIILFCPLYIDILDYIKGNKTELLYSTGISIVISCILCALVLPVTIGDHQDIFFCFGFGCSYQALSFHPFTMENEFFFRHILMPVLGYYTGLTGNLYPILSFSCTFLLIVSVVQFLRSKTDYQLMPRSCWHQGFIIVLSLTTSGFVLIGLQWPGYPEQLAFIFLLILFLVPMRPELRMASVALAMLSHEGSVFPLVPIILCAFPRREVIPALALIPIFTCAFAVGGLSTSLRLWCSIM